MPNGDIVSGCSDKIVRVFSRSEDRWLPEADLKAFDDQVASQSLPAQQVGDIKTSDLPGLEALSAPGKKAGETKMVKNGDVVEAHQWDSASSSWIKIGTVVDAVGSGRKQLYQGKEYDYVFDVDVHEGAPPLKLPFNITENPWTAAQRFLEANELPPSYVDEIVRFIEKNTQGIALGGGSEAYSDPFTGGARYHPSSGSVPTNTLAADPFTGGSRYQPSPSGSTLGGVNSFADPFTGASRYHPAGSTSLPVTSSPSSHRAIPHVCFVGF
jgi:phospholipase A-2-activating protein